MKNRIFPYQTLQGDVRLNLSGGGLDDSDWPKVPYVPDRRLVELYDLDKEDWQRASFNLELTLSADEVAKMNKAGASVSALAVIECPRTMYRETLPLFPASPGETTWTGTVELERDNFGGKATIHGLVVGTINGRENRFLSETEAWILHIDEPDISPLTGTMRVRWMDFDQPADDCIFLVDYRDHPFYSDLQSEKPTLFLNRSKRFSGLPTLLDDRKRKPSERPLHNSERISIARSVWMALLNTSIASIIVDDGETPEWPTEDWKRMVLKSILSKVFPAKSESELLSEAVDAWRSNERAGKLESRAQAVIDDKIAAGRLLRLTLDYMARSSEID